MCGRGGYMLCVIIESRKSRNDIGPPSSSLYVRASHAVLFFCSVLYIRTRRGGLFFHFPFSLPTGIISTAAVDDAEFLYTPPSLSLSLCYVAS